MPTPEQMQALRDFAASHGRYWKMALHALWHSTRCPPLLQQVRNEFGPAWLAKFREFKGTPSIL